MPMQTDQQNPLLAFKSLKLMTKPSPMQTVQTALCKLPYANYKPCQQTPPLALMENFKSRLPLLTSMAKESTILPLRKENHLERCTISTTTPPINNSQ